MKAGETTLRYLVACEGCKRQYDASGLAQGSQFHCTCGAIIKVPRFQPQDASVVRCSSCSAPRTKGALSCQHCGADYTLHERDLQTICPTCMTRVSDRARYCHHCATPITPVGDAGSRTTCPCPVCDAQASLNERTLGDPPITVLECPRCAGLWLSREAFEIVADRARERTRPDQLLHGGVAEATSEGQSAASATFYRRCPRCRKYMNRSNFGRKSGVILDVCKEHGLWFDARELGVILKWIKEGGEVRAAREAKAELAEAERQKRFRVDPVANVNFDGQRPSSLMAPSDMLSRFLGSLFDL